MRISCFVFTVLLLTFKCGAQIDNKLSITTNNEGKFLVVAEYCFEDNRLSLRFGQENPEGYCSNYNITNKLLDESGKEISNSAKKIEFSRNWWITYLNKLIRLGWKPIGGVCTYETSLFLYKEVETEAEIVEGLQFMKKK